MLNELIGSNVLKILTNIAKFHFWRLVVVSSSVVIKMNFLLA